MERAKEAGQFNYVVVVSCPDAAPSVYGPFTNYSKAVKYGEMVRDEGFDFEVTEIFAA